MTDDEIDDREADDLARFRIDQLAAHNEKKREIIRATLEGWLDNFPAMMAELHRMRRDTGHLWRARIESAAAKRTRRIEAQLAEASAALEAADQRARDAESLAQLAMTWGAQVSRRETAQPAAFPAQAGGEPWTPQPGVYFVLNEGTGQVKIGRHEGDMDGRLRRARTDCGGAPLRVLAMLRDDGKGTTEKKWHRRFKSKRTLGEWFRLAPSDIPPTEFSVAQWARSEVELTRRCDVCDVSFTAHRHTQTICGSGACRYRQRLGPNVERLRAWQQPATFNATVPDTLAKKFAERGRSLSSGARDLLLARVGVARPLTRSNSRGVGTAAKRLTVSLVLPPEAWPKIIEATIEGGHRSPNEWAEAVLRSAA